MPLAQSDKLQIEFDKKKGERPPQVRSRDSIKSFLGFALPVFLTILVFVFALIYVWGMQFLWLVLLLVGAACLIVYPKYWQWRHNFKTGDPESAMLQVEDNPLPWFLIFGSEPEDIPLASINLETPRRSALDKLIFNCGTVTLGEKKLKNLPMPFIRGLRAIKKHKESLEQQDIELASNQAEIQLASLRQQEINNELLARMAEDIAYIASCLKVVNAPDVPQQRDPDDTQEIPVRRPESRDDDTMPNRPGGQPPQQ